MSVWDLPTGATVYRTFHVHRHGFAVETFHQQGEIVEMKKEEKRYVRDQAGFIYQLSAEWHEDRAAAALSAAMAMEAGGRRLLEQAEELRTMAMTEA